MVAYALRAENKKLKGSPVWIAFIVLPLISAVIGTVNYMGNIGILKDEWYSLGHSIHCFCATFLCLRCLEYTAHICGGLSI